MIAFAYAEISTLLDCHIVGVQSCGVDCSGTLVVVAAHVVVPVVGRNYSLDLSSGVSVET